MKKIIPFLVAIKTRVKDIHWDNSTDGITDISGRYLFNDYQSITETGVVTVKTDRTNDRAI